jgi:hypothetical protein
MAQELHANILSNDQDCVILVWGQARTFNALHQLHVNTSGWQTGIKSILGLGSLAVSIVNNCSVLCRNETTFRTTQYLQGNDNPRLAM